MTFDAQKTRAILLAVIMATSVVAMGGLGSAEVTGEDAEIDDPTPEQGTDVTVTVNGTVDNGDSGVILEHDFNQSVGSTPDVDLTVNGNSQELNDTIQQGFDINQNGVGTGIDQNNISAGDDFTISYTFTTEDVSGKSVEITGDIDNGGPNEPSSLPPIEYTTQPTQQSSEQPANAGERTSITSDNPSPSSTRGQAAFPGVTTQAQYSTTSDEFSGDVGDDATIFQGEEDITFRRPNFDPVPPEQLSRTQGDDEGVTLQLPIPEDQTIGAYAGNGITVTVQQPRVTTLEVQNNGGSDVSGGILESDQDAASVFVEYNYEEAENIELTVEDENGVDVTGEAVSGNSSKNAVSTTPTGESPDGSVRFDLQPGNLDTGEYTFTVEGAEDLDFGSATQSVTATISAEQTASLSLSEDTAEQGSNVVFTVENSPEGEFHPVVIDATEFRDSITVEDAQNIFRSVGDTTETGIVSSNSTVGVTVDDNSIFSNDDDTEVGNTDVQYAYGIVEIDGGSGTGSVETRLLDDSTATIELYPSNIPGVGAVDASHPAGAVLTTNDDVSTDDEEDIDIIEGDISISEPSDTYVVGSEVTLNGTANEGIDEVAIYARNNQDYQLVRIDGQRTVQTEGDDNFEESDIVLSDPGVDLTTVSDEYDSDLGNGILALPGTYRIGVISAADADDDDTDDEPEPRLSTSDFNSGLSSQQSLRVLDTALESSFVTYNGQIATDDGQITFSGTAPGKDNVIVAFVGPRGNAVAETINVDDDDTFSEEDFTIPSTELSEGTVSAHIISAGRDGAFGDGFADSESDFVDEIETNFSEGPNTGDQVRELIIANTVDDTASDDLITTETFRFADGLTTIDSVTNPVANNETIEIQGQTNQRPDENVITVELLDEEGDSVTISDTEQWGTDGNWNATIELNAVETGNYTVEADDGDNSDRVSVQVVEQVTEETPTPEPTATEEPTPTATPEPTATEEPTPTATATPTATSTPETETGTPGFGIVVALIALIAAALLAVRRNN